VMNAQVTMTGARRAAGCAGLLFGGVLLALVNGCAHQYGYIPVGPGSNGGAAASYPVPPEAPQGEVYLTSFGFTDMDLGPNQPGRVLHSRLAVSNGSAVTWNVDSRQQMMVAQGAQLAAVAVAVGVPASLALTRLLRSLLYGVAPTDVATHAVTSAAIFALALLASWLPARRASRIDPMIALRAE